MAIQGIIAGFANPDARQENLLLIGRGGFYALIVDGTAEKTAEDLSSAQAIFDSTAKHQKIPSHWLNVTAVSTSNTSNPVTVVDACGTFSFGEYEGNANLNGAGLAISKKSSLKP